MALAFERVLETADAARALSAEIGALLAKVDRFVDYNSDQAIDWNAVSKPSYIDEDPAGNINGRRFSRTDVGNMVGSLVEFQNYMKNASVSQGDHLGNFNKLSQPMPLRS